jgi:TatD DNase family protein
MTCFDIHTHHSASPGVTSIRNLLNPDTLSKDLENEGLFSAGLHPWHLHPDHWEEDLEEIRRHLNHPNLVAIGEAGLDRLVDLPLELQKDVFLATVRLSEESKKPLIIHAVRTHAEIALLHAQLKPAQPWIIHGYNLRKTIGEGLIRQGICLSFGAPIFEEGSPASAMLESMPEDLFFLESDEAQFPLPDLYRRAAVIRGTPVEDLAAGIEKRFKKMFLHG